MTDSAIMHSLVAIILLPAELLLALTGQADHILGVLLFRHFFFARLFQ